MREGDIVKKSIFSVAQQAYTYIVGILEWDTKHYGHGIHICAEDECSELEAGVGGDEEVIGNIYQTPELIDENKQAT